MLRLCCFFSMTGKDTQFLVPGMEFYICLRESGPCAIYPLPWTLLPVTNAFVLNVLVDNTPHGPIAKGTKGNTVKHTLPYLSLSPQRSLMNIQANMHMYPYKETWHMERGQALEPDCLNLRPSTAQYQLVHDLGQPLCTPVTPIRRAWHNHRTFLIGWGWS